MNYIFIQIQYYMVNWSVSRSEIYINHDGIHKKGERVQQESLLIKDIRFDYPIDDTKKRIKDRYKFWTDY